MFKFLLSSILLSLNVCNSLTIITSDITDYCKDGANIQIDNGWDSVKHIYEMRQDVILNSYITNNSSSRKNSSVPYISFYVLTYKKCTTIS